MSDKEGGWGGLLKNAVFLLAWWKLYLYFGGSFVAAWSLKAAMISFVVAAGAVTIFWLIAGGLVLAMLALALALAYGVWEIALRLSGKGRKTLTRRKADAADLKRLEKQSLAATAASKELERSLLQVSSDSSRWDSKEETEIAAKVGRGI